MAPLAILTDNAILAEGDGTGGTTPDSVKPDYGYFPFMSKLTEIAGGVTGVVIVVLVILAVVGVALIVAGKLGSSNMAQRVGWGMLVVCVVAAAVAANAGRIIGWGSNQELVDPNATAQGITYVAGSLLP